MNGINLGVWSVISVAFALVVFVIIVLLIKKALWPPKNNNVRE